VETKNKNEELWKDIIESKYGSWRDLNNARCGKGESWW